MLIMLLFTVLKWAHCVEYAVGLFHETMQDFNLAGA